MESISVIADSHSFDALTVGQSVGVEFRDFVVYKDDGRDDHSKILKILT